MHKRQHLKKMKAIYNVGTNCYKSTRPNFVVSHCVSPNYREDAVVQGKHSYLYHSGPFWYAYQPAHQHAFMPGLGVPVCRPTNSHLKLDRNIMKAKDTNTCYERIAGTRLLCLLSLCAYI